MYETGVPYESGIIHYVDPDAAGGPLDQAREHAAARMGDGYVLSVRDASARKAAEDEINRLNADLERWVAARTAGLQAANAELQTFSYTVSHDLRSPLRAMTGFAELLAKRGADRLDERSRHYLDNIIEAGERMSQLIEELLEYSRLGRSHVQAEPVLLGPVLHRIRQAMAGRIKATHGALMVVEPLAVPVADPVLLERMLVNLLDNAFLYRRAGVAPVVTVSAVRHGRRVTLAVDDNGIGIPAEYREKVFEPFVRLHGADEYPGTGIGLAMVRKAAALLDSAVRVESTVGAGSTFSLDLPAAGQTVA
ncbi:MAG TPA: ATP-binding protein [Candidatus Limnocylindrales bacterium]|nr:ATP-binding protein [Candidatus Limnocylindrales bacterium]